MAIHENLSNSIAQKENPYAEPWLDHYGTEVEDFITRNMIIGGEYDTNSEKLLLKRADGSTLSPIDISVQMPTYSYGIILYGIRIDGGDVQNGDSLLMQYREGRKIELGVAIQSVADRSGTLNTVSKAFDVTIKFNNASMTMPIYPINHTYFKPEGTGLVLDIPEGEKAEDIVVWVDVTNMLKRSCTGKKFEASFIQTVDNTPKTFKGELKTAITNEVIKLVYKGNTVVLENSLELLFDPNTTIPSNYKLSGYIGQTPFDNLKGVMKISNLQPGLNKISVRAVHYENPDVYTDWLTFDVIYAAEGYTKTSIAVNGVSDHITNNGIATLYELTIHSPKSEEIEITTFLEDELPDLSSRVPEKILKLEIINPSSYDITTGIAKSTYKKYMEVMSDGATKYLVIRLGDAETGEYYYFQDPGVYKGENYLDSYDFKEMTVEAINTNYTYVNNYSTSLNFDQIVGQTNDVFVTDAYAINGKTATITSALESSDGWHDNNGRTYFKVSAQPLDIFTNGGLNPKLEDDFTIELGIKTYNASDINSNILTIGRLLLRPTSVCWELDEKQYSDPTKYLEDLLKRISKFQEGVETHIVITLNSNWCITDYPDFYYPDFLGEEEEIFKKYSESTRGNLVRIYINGVIDREYILSGTDVEELKKAVAQIHTESADVDFYLFRVYNNLALDFSEVIRNYISFLPEKTGRGSKEEFYNKNDILKGNTISWERCLGKVNTLLYVFPTGGYFPNRFWGGEDGDTKNPNKKAHVSLFVNYADPKINVLYGGRLNHLQVKGQGSSAMRYLIWNVSAQMKKHTEKVFDEQGNPVLNKKGEQEEKKINSYFKPQGLLLPESIPEDYTAVESLKELKNCYYMPPYEGLKDPNASKYPYKKMVGKVNYASSMQSHKIGACKLFADAYYSSLGALRSGGLKAVHEEPFMYFYLETNLSNDQVAEMTWEEVMEYADRGEIKFMGFQTWGPGKGDDACSGFDEDLTPEYLILEGGENGDESVNFLVPWMALQRGNENIGSDALAAEPTLDKNTSLEHPEYKIWIDDESVVYKTDDKGSPIGAWDIDYGVEEVKKDVDAGILKGYFKFADDEGGYNVLNSLKKFRNFYDLVYLFDFTFVVEPATAKYPGEDWDINKKHLVQSGTFKYKSTDTENVKGHQPNDVYRYDVVNKKWVRAGLYYDSTLGSDGKTPNGWDRLNYLNSFYGYEISQNRFNEYIVRNELRDLFATEIGAYDISNNQALNKEGLIDYKDIAFHQAFVKYLSGTDNRAKNTYFLIIGPVYKWVDEDAGIKELNEAVSDYKIRLIGDDLDTILATDNNGLQSKDYNLVEDSYDSTITAWGDKGNIFFRMFDLSFEIEIRKRLGDIMTTAGMASTGVNETSSYFYRTFFKVQEDFPAIAYNHTAKIYYENAYAVYNAPKLNGVDYGGFKYLHNGVDPISQSHGSCLECEKQFMKERIGFLAGYALSCLDGGINISGGSGGGASNIKLLLEFEPFQDFYPTYNAGDNDNSFKSIGDLRTFPTQAASYEDLQKAAITNRYVARQGETYVSKINDSGLHQWLLQVGMFKTLSITGMALTSLTGHFGRAVDFEIDNTKIAENKDFFGDWPNMAITDTITSVGLPVVLNLNLKQMVLPNTLDLSSYYKLQNLDLTSSTTKYVVFPQTGILENVILPSTIDALRIYNNPGLKELRIESVYTDDNGNVLHREDLSNLKVVYIDCAKCGALNVEEFCEKLVSIPVLEEVTLVNANNLKMTEATIAALSTRKCRLTGSFKIVNDIHAENPTRVAISFATKDLLIRNFGMITDKNNEVFIDYEPKTIYDDRVTCQEVIHLYLGAGKTKDTFENAFGLSISDGNDVTILAEPNPYNSNIIGRLDISYANDRKSGMSSIDPMTGVITVTGNSTVEDTITITINTDGLSQPIVKTCKLICSWVAPSLGDFAYADGSFSSAFNPNKTLVGLVYHKEIVSGAGTDAEKGTIYIMGKEYSCDEDLYTGINWAHGDMNKSDEKAKDLARLLYLVENGAKLTAYSTPTDVEGIGNAANFEITAANMNTILGYERTGQTDTELYVKHVEKFLTFLRTKDSSYDSFYNRNSLRIESIKNLKDFSNALVRNDFLSSLDDSPELDYQLSDTDYNRTVLYPYFYSMYLYSPELLEGETLDSNFAQGKWYAPSVGELSIAILDRGMSVSSNFSTSDLKADIKTNAVSERAIFSRALDRMKEDFPSAWRNLLTRGQNIITNAYTSGTDNYGYSIGNDNNVYKGKWVGGEPPSSIMTNGGWEQWTYYNQDYWRMIKHKGIPFTHCTYEKPNN